MTRPRRKVLIDYQPPKSRAGATLYRGVAISTGVALLMGLYEILEKLPRDQPLDLGKLAFLLIGLGINVLLLGLRKYATAVGEETT